jgi:hypothetical protein
MSLLSVKGEEVNKHTRSSRILPLPNKFESNSSFIPYSYQEVVVSLDSKSEIAQG